MVRDGKGETMTPPTREEREELERWMESDCNSQSWREKMTPIITALARKEGKP